MRNELITTSSAGSPLGNGAGRKLLRIPDGTYANRMVLLYQDTPSTISLSFADAPYTNWSAPQTIEGAAADSPFDCFLNSNGDIFLAYTSATTFNMMHRHLTFSAGTWTIGAANIVYSVDDCYFPSIILELPDRLWITYTRIVGGNHYINAIKSDNWGATWTVNAGEELAGPDSSAYSQITIAGGQLYVFYTLGGAKLAERNKYFNIGAFANEVPLASGSGFDQHFHARVAADSRIGLSYDDGALHYREFDGSQWLAVESVDSSGGDYPRTTFTDNIANVYYLQSSGVNQTRLLSASRTNGVFSASSDLIPTATQLDNLTLFSQGSGSYADLTSEAASSGALSVVGDAIYFGQNSPFNYLKLIFATAGVGGTVDWRFFDGSGWVSFTPTDGAYHLTTSSRELNLWTDGSVIPSTWQQTVINGVTKFYVRALVKTNYSIKPIATQITAIANLSEFITEG